MNDFQIAGVILLWVGTNFALMYIGSRLADIAKEHKEANKLRRNEWDRLYGTRPNNIRNFGV